MILSGMECAWEKPLCLIENSDDKGLCGNEETFAELCKIKDPVSVVSIVGLYRTGKSYLMNLLADSQKGQKCTNYTKQLTYLQFRSDEKWVRKLTFHLAFYLYLNSLLSKFLPLCSCMWLCNCGTYSEGDQNLDIIERVLAFYFYTAIQLIS